MSEVLSRDTIPEEQGACGSTDTTSAASTALCETPQLSESAASIEDRGREPNCEASAATKTAGCPNTENGQLRDYTLGQLLDVPIPDTEAPLEYVRKYIDALYQHHVSLGDLSRNWRQQRKAIRYRIGKALSLRRQEEVNGDWKGYISENFAIGSKKRGYHTARRCMIVAEQATQEEIADPRISQRQLEIKYGARGPYRQNGERSVSSQVCSEGVQSGAAMPQHASPPEKVTLKKTKALVARLCTIADQLALGAGKIADVGSSPLDTECVLEQAEADVMAVVGQLNVVVKTYHTIRLDSIRGGNEISMHREMC